MTLAPLAPSTGCRLVAADGRDLPLRAVDVAADAGGGLARVRLRQTFVNPYTEPLAVTYLLPLPADAAVVDLAFVLAGQRVVGAIQRRADARAAFEQAVLEGRTATLLEQERSSLFTQALGNLPPGAVLEVELDVEQPLRWVAGGWEWRWPTVVAPRYLGAETPDADRVTVDVADRPIPVACTARVGFADALVGAPSSPSHALSPTDGGVALVGLLDRDVVVRWPVVAPVPGVRLEVARPDGDADAYGLLTLVPPAVAGDVVPRDLCLLLDTSGSMSGAPLAQLVAFSTALVQGLRSGDQLELIEFSSAPRRWRSSPAPIDATSRDDALRWLAALRAGGGTAMHEAVTEALAPLRPVAQRQVVLVTDGHIGFESQVIGRIRRALPRGSRIHTVGIGGSVNRTLTGGVARAGGGHEAIVGPDEAVSDAVAGLLARTGDPLWTEVAVSGSALREQAPAVIPDLLAGAPARVSLRLAREGGSLVISARTASGPVVQELLVGAAGAGEGRRVVATRFAREKVEDLELAAATGDRVDAAIEALGLRHRIATRMTSWVAISASRTVDPADPTRRQVMPHALPFGVSAEGVGLRRATPDILPMMAPMTSQAPRARSMAAPMPPAPAPSRPPEAARKAAAEAAPAKRRVKARKQVLPDGRVLVTFDADAELAWEPRGSVVASDGSRAPLAPLDGTTRAGRVAAGATVRIVLAAGSSPTRLELDGLIVDLA